MTPDDVLTFWFDELDREDWFKRKDGVDELIRQRFVNLHASAVKCELWHWRRSPRGRLAEIIVLDQFSRNIYRDDARAFAADPQALVLAQEAVAAGADAGMTETERQFLYMPYMHSESLAVHEEAMRLYEALGQDEALDYERRHQAIIARFGRYPHRNAMLGRQSTAKELAFLEEPGSSF